MNSKNQLLCIWGGYAFLPVYAIGFALFAGFVPIPSPNLNGGQIAALFEANQTRILIGQIFCVYASASLVPWSVAIFNLLIRIEDKPHLLSHVQLTAGALGVVFFMAPSFVWGTMAFRIGHSPEIMLVLSDLAWIAWVISVPTFILQLFVIGYCTLTSTRERNLIPRWLAWLSIWTGITLMPADVVLLFKSGPFAWNGLIAVYLPMTLYVIWYHSMLFVLLKVVKAQQPSNTESLVTV